MRDELTEAGQQRADPVAGKDRDDTGRGLVKAVEPRTGWVTLAHNDIMGCMPAMEMMFRVQTPDVSRGLKPGDTIDFTLDGGNYVVLDARLVSRAQ